MPLNMIITTADMHLRLFGEIIKSSKKYNKGGAKSQSFKDTEPKKTLCLCTFARNINKKVPKRIK